MCGGEKCLLVGQIYKACENVRCSQPIVIHCLIHFQVLCGKFLNPWCITEPLVSTVNFICYRRLNCSQSMNFCQINRES